MPGKIQMSIRLVGETEPLDHGMPLGRTLTTSILRNIIIVSLGHSNYYLCFALPEHGTTYQSFRKKKKSQKKTCLNVNK